MTEEKRKSWTHSKVGNAIAFIILVLVAVNLISPTGIICRFASITVQNQTDGNVHIEYWGGEPHITHLRETIGPLETVRIPLVYSGGVPSDPHRVAYRMNEEEDFQTIDIDSLIKTGRFDHVIIINDSGTHTYVPELEEKVRELRIK